MRSLGVLALAFGVASAFVYPVSKPGAVVIRQQVQVGGCRTEQALSGASRAEAMRLAAAGDDFGEEGMWLTEENAELALQRIRDELPTLFGYSAENRAVGITGEVEFVELDGIDIVIRLKGRFWHDRNMVLARVANAMKPLIPEANVRIEDPRQLQAGDDDAKSVEQFYAH